MKGLIVGLVLGYVAYKVLTSKPMKIYLGAVAIEAGSKYLKKRLKG